MEERVNGHYRELCLLSTQFADEWLTVHVSCAHTQFCVDVNDVRCARGWFTKHMEHTHTDGTNVEESDTDTWRGWSSRTFSINHYHTVDVWKSNDAKSHVRPVMYSISPRVVWNSTFLPWYQFTNAFTISSLGYLKSFWTLNQSWSQNLDLESIQRDLWIVFPLFSWCTLPACVWLVAMLIFHSDKAGW